jgi:hypothetical protein
MRQENLSSLIYTETDESSCRTFAEVGDLVLPDFCVRSCAPCYWTLCY